jgi:hypothetical protein
MSLNPKEAETLIPNREEGSVFPVKYTDNLSVLDHDVSQIEIVMSKHIGFALRQALLQVLQNLLREVAKVKGQSILELLVRVKRSTGSRSKNNKPG